MVMKSAAWRKRYAQEHYEKNRAKYAATRRRTKERRLKWYADLMKGKQCKHCGTAEGVLEWHHFDMANKIERISVMVRQSRPIEVILEEMAKCWVLCKPCHCRAHYGIAPGEGVRHDAERRKQFRRLKYLRTGT